MEAPKSILETVRDYIATATPEQVAAYLKASDFESYHGIGDEITDKSHSMNTASAVECHGLDTPERVCFYENDFYVLSNFSSFNVFVWSVDFPTAEHAYHWRKFSTTDRVIADLVRNARSPHESLKIATENTGKRRKDWDEVKVEIMREILRAKVAEHQYVHRKLLATGDRELVENSWRDGFWGWGPNRDGQNMLGKLWMDVRTELRKTAAEAYREEFHGNNSS